MRGGVALRRHPSRARLHAWLDGELASELDDHLRTCERCAGVLEASAAGTPPFGSLLDHLLAAPADLEARLRSGIAGRLQTREDLRLMVELLGVPAETLRALGAPPPTQAEADQP
jgi:anti-sigma factor RsiW